MNKTRLIINFISVSLFFLTLPYIAYGQDGCVRVRVISGGNVPILINTYNKYKNGLLLDDWTTLNVHVSDSCNFGTILSPDYKYCNSWSLKVRASDDPIKSDDGPETISLNSLKLIASTTTGGTPQIINTLSSTVDQELIQGSSPAADVNGQVTISFYFGDGSGTPAAENVMGKDPGYYYVELIFTLTANYP